MLGLLHISDSAFPTCAFAHSLGLEAIYEAGELAGSEDLELMIKSHLYAAATPNCVALRPAYEVIFSRPLFGRVSLVSSRVNPLS